MLTDLQTSVTDISPEQLDKLFEGVPDTTVTADDLEGGKKEGTTSFKSQDTALDLPNLDLDELDSVEDEPAGDGKEAKNEPATDATPDPNAEAKKDEPKEEKEGEAELKARAELYKSSVDFLVQKGLFKDFEGREDLQLDDETFAELWEAQVKAAAEERYSQQKSAVGEYGQAILEYIEQGGDADKVIDLFKEQQQLQQLDTTEGEGQRELVEKYYREVLGWKADRIKRMVDGLESEDGALEAEAGEIKDKYDELYKKQLSKLQEEQQAYNQEQERRKQTFVKTVSTTIDSVEDYDDQTKTKLKNALFKYKKLQDGSEVNDFYLKFAEWQADPKKYVKLVEFITDEEGYEKRRDKKAETKVADKTFKFVKGNTAVARNTGAAHASPEGEGKASGTNFSVIFKK